MLVRVVGRTPHHESERIRNFSVTLDSTVAIDAHGVGDDVLASQHCEFEGVSGLDWSFTERFDLGENRAAYLCPLWQIDVGIKVCERDDKKATDEEDAD